MAATTVLYLLYSLHTAAYKGSTASGAPRRNALPEELVAIVGAGGMAEDGGATDVSATAANGGAVDGTGCNFGSGSAEDLERSETGGRR